MFVQIEKLERNLEREIFFLSSDIFRNLELDKYGIYNINVGHKKITGFIHEIEMSKEKMYFTKNKLEDLFLYEGLSLNIWKKDNDIFLGPVVGILISTEKFNALKKDIIEPTDRKIFEANEQSKCLLYYFSRENFYYKEKVTYGLTILSKDNNFSFVPLPLPQVVREQLEDIMDKDLMAYQYMRKFLTYELNIKYINSHSYLGKWEVYKALSKYTECKEYLPKTIPFDSFEDVVFMLQNFNTIFLKCSYEDDGIEILSIENIMEGYRVLFGKEKVESLYFDNLNKLQPFIESCINEKFFIISEGINILKVKNQKAVFRILVQKNNEGNWCTINIKTRIIKDNFEKKDYGVGKQVLNYEDVYNSLKKKYGNDIPNEDYVKGLTIIIAAYLEKELGDLGELEIDMSIDQNGKLWFIGAGIIQSNTYLTQLENNENNMECFLNVLEYSKFLTE